MVSPESSTTESVSPTQVQAALDRFDLGKLVEIVPISWGLFGQNVFVNTDTQALVLRCRPHYDWQLRTEQSCAEFLHKAGIPAPWPYLGHTW